MKNITKEQFLNVNNKYKPNLFINFMYKYFSINKKSIGLKFLFLYFFICNIILLIIDNINERSSLLLPLILITVIPFFIWGILSIIAFILNIKRHHKIKNELGLTIDEYNKYILLYNKYLI